MNVLSWLFLYPFIWQSIFIFLFTLALIWSLIKLLSIKDANLRVFIYTLPIIMPLLLPFKGQIGLIHWVSLFIFDYNLAGEIFLIPLFSLICLLPLILLIARGLLSYWSYRRILRNTQEITPAEQPKLFSLLAALSQKAGIPLPRVYQLPPGSIHIFTCGTFRPSIVLSPTLLSKLPTAELEAVLAHEVAHLARRDQVTCWIVNLISTLMFYNPFLYPLIKRLSREREKAADAFAVKLIKDPRTLAQGLLSVMKLASEKHSNFMAMSMPLAKLTDGDATYERIKILLAGFGENNETSGQAWRFGFLFLSMMIIFSLFILPPLWQYASCAIMMP